MNWHEVAEVATPALGCLGVITAPFVGGWFGRRAANRTAEANADAVTQDAFTRAHEAARKDWAIHVEAMQRWCEAQAEEVQAIAERQATIVAELEAERSARGRAERLYRVALSYLHRIFSWVAYHVPGEALPPPPAEMVADLDGWPFQKSPHTGD